MKMVSEYLAESAHFQRLAAEEKNLTIQGQLLDQAEAYYKLAVRRANALNLPLPMHSPARASDPHMVAASAREVELPNA